MAPPESGCTGCHLQRVLSIGADTEWQEVELAPNRHYAAELAIIEGASRMQLFALDPDAPLRNLHCEEDAESLTTCEFESTRGGLLGIEVAPTSREARVFLEVAPAD
jgi:hypothetical protein